MRKRVELHSTGIESASLPSGSTLSIGEVSALLAVPAPTIRSWERRHALSAATRNAHGHRRYTDADVAVLRRLRDERAIGVRASQAVATATTAPPPELCRQMLAATHQFDEAGISATLDASVTAHGLPLTLEEVLLPVMREIGEQWARGECNVAKEHLATAAVLAWLARRAAEAPPPLGDRPIVLSCGPQDQHTIALDAFAVLLRHARFDCRSLGAQTPAASLRVAVDGCSAAAVVLVSQLGRGRPAAVAALRALSDSGATLFYSGAAFVNTASRRGLPGHYLGGSLSEATRQLTDHLRGT